MAKVHPEKLDIDTGLLDVFTDAAEQLIAAYEDGRITAESCVAGVSDLVTITKKVPRSVTITLEGSEAVRAIRHFEDMAEEAKND